MVFADINEDNTSSLLRSKDSKSTQRSVARSIKLFKDYLLQMMSVWYSNGRSSVTNRKTSAGAGGNFCWFGNLRSQRVLNFTHYHMLLCVGGIYVEIITFGYNFLSFFLKAVFMLFFICICVIFIMEFQGEDFISW
jgi:hypothetical protein